jgi:BirA family biotin operon repressor/biotin-[acetyl-CoA-carboxylase] ligase
MVVDSGVTDRELMDLGLAVDLIRFLADGRWRSFEAIGERLAVSVPTAEVLIRAACDRLGLRCLETAEGAVRLQGPLALLDRTRILSLLHSAGCMAPAHLEVHDAIDSTNQHLMTAGAHGAPSGSVCLAEYQTAGRGRLGRTWVSPFGANLYLSVLWRVALGPEALGGCSLAVGAALAETLRAAGVDGLGLKWPNDLLWQRRKLAGVLLEVSGPPRGPSTLIVGVGINVNMPPEAARDIDQPWVDLREILGVALCDRDWVAAQAIHAVWSALEGFERDGLGPALALWSRFDRFRGESVQIHTAGSVLHGTIVGIAADGRLRLLTLTGERLLQGGEVSLRPVGAGTT